MHKNPNCLVTLSRSKVLQNWILFENAESKTRKTGSSKVELATEQIIWLERKSLGY